MSRAGLQGDSSMDSALDIRVVRADPRRQWVTRSLPRVRLLVLLTVGVGWEFVHGFVPFICKVVLLLIAVTVIQVQRRKHGL